jgi:hypothetical protein
MLKAVRPVNLQQSTQCYKPEDGHLQYKDFQATFYKLSAVRARPNLAFFLIYCGGNKNMSDSQN